MKSVQSPASTQVNSSAQPDTGLGRAHPPSAQTPVPGAVRIDIRRLARLVFYALVLPGSVGIGSDFLFGLFPLLTLATVVLVFPIAGFLIMRAALREMEGVIQQVAPPEEETDTEAPTEMDTDEGLQINQSAQDEAQTHALAKEPTVPVDATRQQIRQEQDPAIKHADPAHDRSKR